MVKSMTAYARVADEGPLGQMVWELRSVNNRYLEVNLRLPETLRPHEARLRARIGEVLGRGKLDATLKFSPAAAAQSLQIDEPAVDQLVTAIRQVTDRIGGMHTSPLDPMALLQWPGIARQRQSLDTEQLVEWVSATLDEALEELIAHRRREGAQLQRVIESKLAELQTRCDAVKQRYPLALSASTEKLRARVLELSEQVEPQRLEQELAILAQKADIAEELDRLAIHIAETAATLQRDEPIGRRLDFLMQELNRETNTTGAKSIDAQITQQVVDMKVLVEQMREQVQNIE